MATLRGIDHLRRARDILCEDPRPAAGRLAEAMHAFWAASTGYDSWPPAFRDAADEIRRRIFGGGTIAETAEAMDEAGFVELRDRVRRFVHDAERHDDGPLAGPHGPPGDGLGGVEGGSGGHPEAGR